MDDKYKQLPSDVIAVEHMRKFKCPHCYQLYPPVTLRSLYPAILSVLGEGIEVECGECHHTIKIVLSTALCIFKG